MEKSLISTDIDIQCVFIENKINPKSIYSKTMSHCVFNTGKRAGNKRGQEKRNISLSHFKSFKDLNCSPAFRFKEKALDVVFHINCPLPCEI